MRKTTIIFLLVIFISGLLTTHAWIAPEHRDITLNAIQRLSLEDRLKLDSLWNEARRGYEFRLTKEVIDGDQGINPKYLDFASWPAFAGDHSCSAEEMLHSVLETDWILKVADITAQLKIDIANAENQSIHINALRNSDILLQRADPKYATRASVNNAHFPLALPEVSMDVKSYESKCNKEGTEINAISIYTWYHFSALLKASRLSTETLTSEERSKLVLAALADEAFAIHFLEDVFSSGHIAGAWGDASQRKGTHDYYNEKGLRVSTWEGQDIVLTGDAYMRQVDSDLASFAVRLSIEQFLDAASGKQEAMLFNNEIKTFNPDNFSVCKTDYVPPRERDPKLGPLLEKIIMKTPIPGLATGIGELPRFRAELGLFAGFEPSIHGSVISRGFGMNQNTSGLLGGIETAISLGLGMDGVLNEAGDGLVFLSLGWRQDGSSSTSVIDQRGLDSYGNLLAAIPGRSAFSARLRLPFYLVPGDLLIVGPILSLISPETLTNMAVVSANGGLIPWQSGMATSVGRFQLVLGREIAVYLFGRNKEKDAMLNYSSIESGEEQLYFLSYRSTQIEFPILEYSPFRSFSFDQSSTFLIQFYGGIDIPHNIEVLSPAELPPPKLENIWYIGTRLTFDWRHYF